MSWARREEGEKGGGTVRRGHDGRRATWSRADWQKAPDDAYLHYPLSILTGDCKAHHVAGVAQQRFCHFRGGGRHCWADNSVDEGAEKKKEMMMMWTATLQSSGQSALSISNAPTERHGLLVFLSPRIWKHRRRKTRPRSLSSREVDLHVSGSGAGMKGNGPAGPPPRLQGPVVASKTSNQLQRQRRC